ncbi:MAG: hypothetical protein GTO02_22650 [Candidatus Dadabacteria bacterium]|nr:hypothetical protein [Candidatus Dadabacteria bacterium]NIQ17078.1 hypothetical protein [Candidatus Dadabacteria bacterium]
MKNIKNLLLLLALVIVLPMTVFAGLGPSPKGLTWQATDRPANEQIAYYDLRDRQTLVQITNISTASSASPLCIHVQIFQQDRGCSELDFNDQLTPNDTVVYNMDDLHRNDGSAVPVNLADDSYGYVAVSAFNCEGGWDDDGITEALIGNFRIVDDAGYEYRMNTLSEADGNRVIVDMSPNTRANVSLRFNTVDGANQADIVGFVYEENRNLAGQQNGTQDTVFNVPDGVTFSVFQFDENEEPLSCDTVTFACGPGKVMNYGLNDDLPASRGNNVLCQGGGLVPGQTNGFVSLENPVFVNNLEPDFYEFACLIGLNNGDGTGSMDECTYTCDPDDESGCRSPSLP